MTSPSLTTIVRRALAGEASIPEGSVVIVAASGGPDSMALLEVLARVAPTAKLTVRAHGIDHGLRKEASAELDLAATWASELGVPFDRTRVRVSRGGNLQARARAARWEALIAAARAHGNAAGVAVIATGHHADDRAETLLMRLLRGAGLRGLAVLTPRGPAPGADDVTVIRPLLRARRDDIRAHLMRRRISYAYDPSNDDARYLRTRVRAEVLPLLAKLDPGIVGHLGDVADELAALRRDAEQTRVIRASLPPSLPPSLPRWAAELPRATQAAVASLLRSRSRSARVWLPGGLTLVAEAENAPHRPPARKPRG